MTNIFFEEIKPKRSIFKRKKKEEIIKPQVQEKVEDEITKLERELELKKKEIEIKKIEERIKETEKQLNFEKQKELEEKQSVNSAINTISKNEQIAYPSENRVNLKRCPKCSKKLKRFKVKNFVTYISQVVVCKNKSCDYHAELKYGI